MSRLQKATRKKSKLRVLFEGASGSGKTYSALTIANEFGRIAVIDTENGSASLYADKFDFDVLELAPPYSPENYIEAIREVENTGEYDVLIIDSITPEWQGDGGCLDIQNKLGGRFQDWAKVSPRHQRFIDAILRSPLHIVATCRSKADYKMDEKTKKVTKAGTAPQQRDGLDYEFTTVFTLNQNHMAEATKDRTGLFDGREAVITSVQGNTLMSWLSEGAEAPKITNEQFKLLETEVNNRDVDVKKFLDYFRILKLEDMNPSDFDRAIKLIQAKTKKEVN